MNLINNMLVSVNNQRLLRAFVEFVESMKILGLIIDENRSQIKLNYFSFSEYKHYSVKCDIA